MEHAMHHVVSNLARFFLATILVAACGATVVAQQFKGGSIVVEQPWIRATPAGAKVAGGYMTIVNNGREADRLVGGSMPRSGRVEVHESSTEQGVMKMREIAGGLEIKPGQKVQLKPGGIHVMFMDLNAPLKSGETLKGELRFEKAGTMEVEYKVAPVGARGPERSGHQGH
jgi:copper(I)-binding protein